MLSARRCVPLGYLLLWTGCATGGEGSQGIDPLTVGSASAESSGPDTGDASSASADDATAGAADSADTTAGISETTSGTTSGADCLADTDCPSGFCDAGACVNLASCAALLAAQPMTPSGEYEIDPLGTGEPYPAYCDMVSEGGGWTLIMKLTSGSNALAYDASVWTTTDVLNPDDTMPNVAAVGGDAKLRSFNDVTGAALRLEWVEPMLAGHAFVYDELGGQTALQLFSGDEIRLAGDEDSACHGDALADAPGYLSDAMRHGRGHQFYGINGTDASQGERNGGVRFGFGSNDEETSAWAPKHGIGAGGDSAQWSSHGDCNNCGCYGNDYDPNEVSANLWIR